VHPGLGFAVEGSGAGGAGLIKLLTSGCWLLGWVFSEVCAFGQTSDHTVKATICQVVAHPEAFAGKRVRMTVQHVADQSGQDAITDECGMLNPRQLTDEHCLLTFEVPPELYGRSVFARDEFPVHIGSVRRLTPIASWGSSAIVTGTVQMISAPRRKPVVVREREGNVLAMNLWQGRTNAAGESSIRIRVAIDSMIELPRHFPR
jgi:hypothetical protein